MLLNPLFDQDVCVFLTRVSWESTAKMLQNLPRLVERPQPTRQVEPLRQMHGARAFRPCTCGSTSCWPLQGRTSCAHLRRKKMGNNFTGERVAGQFSSLHHKSLFCHFYCIKSLPVYLFFIEKIFLLDYNLRSTPHRQVSKYCVHSS